MGITFRNSIDLPGSGDDVDDYSAGTIIRNRPSYHFGLRYYLLDDPEPQGLYAQLGFAHLTFAKDVALRDSTGAPGKATWADERVYTDVRAYFGYQHLGMHSNWLFDVYAGIGLRTRDRDMVQEHLDVGANTWSYTRVQDRDVVPAFFLGVKVGYGF